MSRRILFVTGTRADFGKLKPLIEAVERTEGFESYIFATGMHMLKRYGSTVHEIHKSGFQNIFPFLNQFEGEEMESVLANTIQGLSRYLHEKDIDLVVVHGDRVEALAGAVVGALRNIRVAHVEGGEVSGTVDELMRHAVSKMSHMHFVASDVAARRLVQLGEEPGAVFQIGSPDIDVMFSEHLPSLDWVRERYEIPFADFGIAMLHPVTTELDELDHQIETFTQALLASGRNYVVLFPNNDAGSASIIRAYERLRSDPGFRVFPSVRFECFLTLLKHAQFIIGNSSAGMHEAPAYGVPTVNIGSRQHRRMHHESIHHCPFAVDDILAALSSALVHGRYPVSRHYGSGDSATKFMEVLSGDVWNVSPQKHFRDLGPNHD